jgi:PleD family two-component response regulator
MGDPDGFEVCRQIKNDPRLAHIPVLILTGEVDVEDRIRGFAAGANDYLAKPFDGRELLARIGALLRLSEQGRELNPTTGLPGGTSIGREFERRRTLGQPFTLCYLDLEYFKPFNDRFGFPTANGLIESLGRIFSDAVTGTSHFAGHIGGDDFVVMCDQDSARPLIERVQAEFARAVRRAVPLEVVEQGFYRGRLRNGVEHDVPLTRMIGALLQLDPKDMPGLEQLGERTADAKRRAQESKSEGIYEVKI